ncbi:MAG: DNA cytosine methyltransferase [Rhizobiaceae bacterium]|nr:DNA cytosine methyltransferase [Rhizobiaceae bacterium]
MPDTPERSDRQLKVVDFFCGAGGMSFGLSQAGLRILAGIDNSKDCQKTYEANVPGAKYIRRDLTRLSTRELARRLGIAPDDPHLVFCGCSPCQFWSKIRTDKTKSVRTAFLLKQFQKFIKAFRPGFVVVENVPGLFRRKDNDILRDFHDFLRRLGYDFAHDIVNAHHYGVPQNRLRYLLIASRFSKLETLPPPSEGSGLSVKDVIGAANGFPRIAAGHRDATEFIHTTMALSEKNQRRIRLTPADGGNRTSWAGDDELQIDAYRGRDNVFRDVYGRMSWDKPAPTITTRFHSLSNGRFGHPEEHRAISIREGASLQTFPRDYTFFSSNLDGLARQIGNAVPPELARHIGRHLIAVNDG